MNNLDRENLKGFYGTLKFQLAASRKMLDACPTLDDLPPGNEEVARDTRLQMRRPFAHEIAAITTAIRALLQRFPELKKYSEEY